MNDKKTKFLVGFFVAIGLVSIVATIIVLGMSNFFQKGTHYSIFFDESVQGLTVEAPVKYRGVPIGRVQQIKVAADSLLIEVVIELDQGYSNLDKIVAQLKVVGITGNMFIELDHPTDKSSDPVMVELSFPTEHPVIPARSSDIKQLFTKVDEIVQKLRTIDIAGLAKEFQDTLKHIDSAIVGSDIAGLSNQFQSSLKQVDSALTTINLPEVAQRLSSLLTNLDKSVQELDIAGLSDEAQGSLLALRQETHELLVSTKPLLSNATKTVGAAENTLENFNRQLLIISQQTERTNSKLNELLDHVSDQPSQLIFGDVPPSRRLK